MAGQKYTLTFDANLNVSQLKNAVNQIQQSFNSLNLPQNITKGFQGTFQKLTEEIRNFEVQSGKEIGSKADFSKLEKSAERISSLFGKLKVQAKDLGGLSGRELQKLFPADVTKNIESADQALKKYNTTLQSIQAGIDNTKKKIADQQNNLKSYTSAINQLTANKSTQIYDTLKKSIQDTDGSIRFETEAETLLRLQQAYEKVNNSLTAYQDKIQKSGKAASAGQQSYITRLTNQLNQLKTAQDALNKETSTNLEMDKQIKTLESSVKSAQTQIVKLQASLSQLTQGQSGQEAQALQTLLNDLQQIQGIDFSKFSQDAAGASQALQQYLSANLQKVIADLQNFNGVIDKQNPSLQSFSDNINQAGLEVANFDDRMREVEQLKSRVQYFFGLNNAIQLVKRTMRDAYETVKSLDKAMTETAVVTDFTVSDMWAQLPDYTKRANQLGVTTQAAYEAATLYYQQGLNTNEVTAMSNETLKMARIAGLDAAEATDRMTNAIRGFNMEINQMNAQRIDDVYSRLAAISASDVDEISTAMTKVASLAHNANMEFETTSAFLAQIIETTRESAETAGTALKTVVARFSEVKKLVDEDQLRGQDEEGQVIDVNKVSQALRTAGIDLNKYFLGEVGLDDIFMELASKWDSLTTMQQRYIATQAAGSRQQSRFIALMSDYARMQELVGEAYNANGAAEKQFEKTQDSLESKLARLKNAWNEFAMGILNSDFIKAGVDVLTTILNVINNLTSGFGALNSGAGSFVSTFAKLALLIGGLNVGKGLSISLLNSAVGLVSGQGAGNLKGTAANAMLGSSRAAELQSASWGKILGQGFLSPFGAVGSGIGGIGKATWGGLKGIGRGIISNPGKLGDIGSKAASLLGGSFGLTSGTSAGLIGLSTALAGVAAAAGVAFAAYKAWEKYTPSGQLKVAKQRAKELEKEADEARQAANSVKELKDSYSEYTSAVDSASTVEEKRTAIQNRNQAILDAIEKNPDYAQYLQTDFDVNGELVLTLDEGQVTAAAVEAARTATEAAVTNYFAQAEVYNKEAEKAAGEALKVAVKKDGTFDEAAYAQAEAESQQYIRLSQKQLELAYASMLSLSGLQLDKTLGEGFTSSLAGALSQITRYTGSNLDQATVSLLGEKLLSGNINSDILTSTIADNIDFSLAGLDFENVDDFNSFLNQIGISSDDLIEFSNAIGDDTNAIEKVLKARAKETQAIQAQNRGKVYQKMYEAGMTLDETTQRRIERFTPQQTQATFDILENAQNLLSESLFSNFAPQLLDLVGTDLFDEIRDLFSSINLDDPISAFTALANAEKNASDELKNYISQIRESNADLFTDSGLVQSFLTSTDYEGLTDSLSKFIETNDRISAENLEELAESSTKLKQLIDATTVSTSALAAAFTLIEQGKLSFDSITDSILQALGAGESFEELIENVGKWIKDFDEGTNFTEGTEHIISEAEKLKEYISGWQFGNEPTENIYDHLFGKGAYDEYMKNNWGQKAYDEIEADLTKQIDAFSNLAKDEGLGALQGLNGKLAGLTGTKTSGGWNFEWDLSQFKSSEEAIAAVQKGIAELTGTTNISTEAAEAFIESWGSHIYGLGDSWNQLKYNDQLTAFANSLSDTNVITQQQLEALGSIVGKGADQVLQDLNTLASSNPEINIPVVVNWQDENGAPLTGDALVKKFESQFGDGTKRRKAIISPDGTTTTQEIDSGFADLEKYVTYGYGTRGKNIRPDNIASIDADALFGDLLSKGLNQQQAAQIANNFTSQINNAMLSRTIQIPKYSIGEDGQISVTQEDITIEADTWEGLSQAAETALETAKYDAVGQAIANQDLTPLGDNVASAIQSGAATGAAAMVGEIEAALASRSFTVNLIAGGLATLFGGVAAGGFVKSFANGTADHFMQPGWALTGEEGPEIVWNKEQGYAYITGANGAEFQNLNPGDRVFNAPQTARILRNSSFAKGGIVPSLSNGGWKTNTGSSSALTGDGSSKDKRDNLDWLYNLMEDIAELERIQNTLSEKHDQYLEDIAKTGRDLYNLTNEQLNNLYTQRDNYQEALTRRLQEMREQITDNELSNYVWWNNEDQTIEIDWDAINEITDKDQYDKVTDLISKAEKIQDEIDDAQDALLDINGQIAELEKRYLQEYIDLQKRVYDAVVYSYQQQIDQLTSLNETLDDSNSQILSSLQKEIELQRQIRDNTDTENSIKELEARLAFLRRDTSGANELEIKELEQQLEDARQDYTDKLIDQAIEKLEESNSEASEQRQKQIDLLTEQLDYWKEVGALWPEVAKLLDEGINGDGSLIRGSNLEKILQNAEEWKGMSQEQRDVWANELILSVNQAGAYLIKMSEGFDNLSKGIWALIPESSIPAGERQYATGGLVTSTGHAWLDGTRSEPEYVLNARQTDAFLKLAEILPSMFNNSVGTTNNFGGNVYVELNMNVGEIGSDYDVDRLIERMRDDIYSASTYRNVNVVSSH